MKLNFLGTGGGRYVTGLQDRQTGGIIVETGDQKLHIDPGPGALVHVRNQIDNPEKIHGVLVSHAHLDHMNDAQAMIEMISEAESQPVKLFANETALHGGADLEKCISDYHQNLCSRVIEISDSETSFEEVDIETQTMFHSDPKTQGFKLEDEEHTIGFWTDTKYSKELTDFYKDSDVLVVYCSRPKNNGVPSHTSLDEVPEILERTNPGTVIITHFGKSFLNEGVEEQREWLDEEVDARVIFAEDGMTFPGNRSLGDF